MSGYRTRQNECPNRIFELGNFSGLLNAPDKRGFFFSVWPYRLIRISLAVVFLWSGVSKLLAPDSFAVVIGAYGIIPDSWDLPVSILLPALEVILAAGILLDVRGSLTGITGLLVLFMAILAYGIQMGLDVDCGCFGPDDPEAVFHDLRPAFYRDLGLMAGIGYLYVWRGIHQYKPVGLRRFFKFYSKRRKEQ